MTLLRNIMRWLKQLAPAIWLGCVALPCTVYAQVEYQAEVIAGENGATEAPEIRIYRVEMIVFEYVDSSLAGSEEFLPEVPPAAGPVYLPELNFSDLPDIGRIGPVTTPSFGDGRSIFEQGPPVAVDEAVFVGDDTPEYRRWLEQQPLDELPSHILKTRLKVLDPEHDAMPGIYAKLLRGRSYRPIMRAAWTQAVYEKDLTVPIDLRRLGNPPLRLDGELTLYISRYLHLVVDLAIDVGEEVLRDPSERSSNYYGDNRTQNGTRDGTRNFFDEDYEIATAPVRYRIFEDRIFRSGEIRYYDHPKFGVLARITRVTETDDEMDGEPPPGDAFLLPPN